MVSAFDPNQDELDENGQPKAPSVAGPTSVSNQSSTIGGGSPASSAPGKGTSSGRFTNISNYLKANQNANLAGKVVGNIENQSNQVKQGLDQAKSQFSNQAEQSRVQANNPFVQSAIQDPNSVANDPSQLQQFERLRDAQYTGPQGLQDAQKLQAGVQNVQSMTRQTGSEGGRFNLLRQMFNKPTYSGGQQKLDNLLLQNNPDQMNKLRGTNVVAGRIGQDLNQSAKRSADVAQQYATEALQTRDSTRNALTTEEQARQNEILGRLAQTQASRTAAQQASEDLLKNRQMSAADLAKYGLTAGTKLYGLDPLSFLRKGQELNNVSQVANQDDVTRFNALSKLAGKDNTFVTGSNPVDDPYTFESQSFLSQVKQKEGAYNADVQNASAPFDAQLADPQLQTELTFDADSTRGRRARQRVAAIEQAKQDAINQINGIYQIDKTLEAAPTN
jgi:hypothetical protein